MKRLACLLGILLVLAVPVFAVEAVSLGWAVGHAFVRPGGQTTIQLTVSNPGMTDTPTYISLVASADPYLTVTPSTTGIASLGPGSSQTTVLDVKVSPSAVSKTAYVTVKAAYLVSGSSRDTTVNIPIKIRRDPILQIENVAYSKSPEPGTSISLSFDLYNAGEGPARDLKISMQHTSTISSTDSSGEIYIAELGPSARRHVEIPIIISSSASPGLYSIPLTLSYYDETKSDLSNISKAISLALGGKADFVVTVDSTKNFYLGRKGTVSLSIANAGSSPAEFLIAKASSQYGEKEFYIGNLDSDDTDVIDVEQDVPITGGKYALSLELSWKDGIGNQYPDVKNIELNPTSAPIEISFTGWVLIVVILGGIGWWIKKRMKRK